jgi:carbon-monoxide dehydrogenase iron sulfur subunit
LELKRVYIKEEVCMGCGLCEVYCQLQHSLSKDIVKAFNRETPQALPRSKVERNGPVSLSLRCQQCIDTPCVFACLTGALSRDAITGIVNVDEEKCVGCGTCTLACPFGAIKQDNERGKAIKCDLCQDEEIPVCVANCPNEALILVEIEEEALNSKAAVITVK